MPVDPPLLLVCGPPGHGVTSYGDDVAHAIRRRAPQTAIAYVDGPDAALVRARAAARTHLHVTDRILGESPEAAAEAIEAMAGVTALTVTLHDVPQPSDGTMFARRSSAFTRIAIAARGVVVNSAHEQQLFAEHLPDAPRPHAIALGARSPRPRAAPAEHRHGDGLDVLIAGYIYPGKGHVLAIDAAAAAVAQIARTGAAPPVAVVRALGGPSRGHDSDVAQLQQRAGAAGVRFEVSGFLDDDAFGAAMRMPGVPVAAHEHFSASRSMLDWVEAGRRPLVIDSRYTREMAALRPGTIDLFEPEALAPALVRAWREPASTWLAETVELHPTMDDVAAEYLTWWTTR